MAKGCSAALAVIWIATVAHALTTPVSMVLTPSTGGLGVQRLLPSLNALHSREHFEPMLHLTQPSKIIQPSNFTRLALSCINKYDGEKKTHFQRSTC